MSGPAVLRLATLNVCGLPSTLDPLAVRADGFCRYFAESRLDVLHFQEVWTRRALALLRKRLPSYPHVAWRRGIADHVALTATVERSFG